MLRPLRRATDSVIDVFDTRFFATAFFVLFGLVIVMIALIRGRQLFQMQTDLELARTELRALRVQHESQQDAVEVRLLQMERTLYDGPVAVAAIPPVPPRRISVIEQGTVNSVKELRERVLQLERWRYRQER